MTQQNITLVNDNTDNPNVGCRATSIALATILSDRNQVLCTIKKRIADKPIRLQTPKTIYRRLTDKLLRKRPHDDWITSDLEDNVNCLLSNVDNVKPFKSFLNNIKSSDCVVINGEGSVIFRPIPRRDLLFQLTTIRLCARLDIPVYYVNAMVSDHPDGTRNSTTANMFYESMALCSGFAVRDLESLRLVKSQANSLDVVHCPDALFGWSRYHTGLQAHLDCWPWFAPMHQEMQLLQQYRFDEPFVVLSGSSLSVEDQEASYRTYLSMAERLLETHENVVLLPCCDRDVPFLRRVSEQLDLFLIPISTPVFLIGSILAEARAFISGRYHPSILASFGGTPCFFLRSNSHKTRSLQELLGYEDIREYSEHPTPHECEEVASHVRSAVDQGESMRNKIIADVKRLSAEAWRLPTVCGLNSESPSSSQ